MQFFYRIEKGAMPNLSTNTYILELCVSALHRGHAKHFKSLTCHQNRGHAALQKKRVCTCHPCTKGHAKFLCAEQNAQPIPSRENRHSFAGSPIICGRLFSDIRTFGRAVEGSSVSPLTNTMGGLSGGGRGGDTSGSVPLLHSSSPGFVPALALDLACGTYGTRISTEHPEHIRHSVTPRHDICVTNVSALTLVKAQQHGLLVTD